jgi:hypothetical protein
MAFGLVDRHHRPGIDLLAQPIGRLRCLIIEGDRLTCGEGLSCFLRHLGGGHQGFGPCCPFRKVLGEYLVLLGQPVCIELFDDHTNKPL